MMIKIMLNHTLRKGRKGRIRKRKGKRLIRMKL